MEFYHNNELKFKIQFKKNSFNFYDEYKIWYWIALNKTNLFQKIVFFVEISINVINDK